LSNTPNTSPGYIPCQHSDHHARPSRLPNVKMAELIPYPETLDLRRLTRDVHQHRPETGKVDFTGTVKVHGTNITVVLRNNGSPPQIQSRNRIITPDSAVTDNSG